MTPESLKTCPLHETPSGMWTSGMQRECLHARGSAKCIEISCPRFGTASALLVCCKDCTDRYAGDCHGCLVGTHQCEAPVEDCLREDKK